jgi:transglutaminase-like putative cysteine protease
MKQYLDPTQAVESAHPAVVELARRICGDVPEPEVRARRIFLFTREEIRYDPFSPFYLADHYRASAIIERGRGYCVQKAVVLAALARASGIPARLVYADIINHMAAGRMRDAMETNLFVFHGYVEMFLGGRWVGAAPTFEKKLCDLAGYPLVEFDGRSSAVQPAADKKGRKFFEYVRRHGAFADVPLPVILKAWEEAYGREKLDFWVRALGGPGFPP